MITNLSATTRRIALSTFAALAFSVALPQDTLAAGTEAGFWKVNPVLSKSASGLSRLVIERVKTTDGIGGAFVVINKGNIYLATPAAGTSSGAQPVELSTWRGMKLTQIGANVKAVDEDCGARCRFGDVSDRLKVTFRNVGAGEQMSNILALGR